MSASKLADKLKINYYDAEIFEAVLKRLEAEKDTVRDSIGYSSNPDLNPNLASAFEQTKEPDSSAENA